jgi:hypothetical protein
MSSTKEKKGDELTIIVMPNGDTRIDFFPVSFSEFIIDNVYSKEERERLASTECRKIYCG